LAHHFEEAGAMVQAADYLVRAGDRALSLRAADEAIRNYQQAMTTYRSSLGEGWALLQRAILERKLGEAWYQKGENQQALEHLRQALAYLGRPLPATRSSVLFAIARETMRQLGHRLLPGFSRRAAGAQVAPDVREAAHIYETMAWIEGFIDPARLLLVSLKHLNLSESHGYADGVGSASMTMGAALDFVPLYGIAEGYHRRAVQAAEQTSNSAVLRLAYSGMAFHNQCVAQFAVAGQYARQAARICEETGDLRRWGWTTDLLAIGLYYLGEHGESLRHLREVEQKGYKGVDQQIQCWSLCSQGAVLWRLGAHAEALEVLQRGIALADEIPDYAYRIGAGGDLGFCYLRQGRLEQALEALHTGERIQAEHPTGWGVNVALYGGLAAAYVAAADLADQGTRAQWLERARRACRDALRVGSHNHQALPEAMRFRGTYEWLRGSRKSAQKWWQRSIGLATQLGIRYDLGMAHLEMGLRLHDRAHLEKAEAILAGIDSAWDAARAREALEQL
jgi:tetratricopeptide (TPR) repeat protein